MEQVCFIGCQIYVDEMGNMFVVLLGKNKDVVFIMMGFYFDIQFIGGCYDGIFGVIFGFEVLCVFVLNNVEMEGLIGVVNWIK